MEPIFDVPNRFFDDQKIVEKSCPENKFSESINKSSYGHTVMIVVDLFGYQLEAYQKCIRVYLSQMYFGIPNDIWARC